MTEIDYESVARAQQQFEARSADHNARMEAYRAIERQPAVTQGDVRDAVALFLTLPSALNYRRLMGYALVFQHHTFKF